jgi:anti-anti-sigma regulatory factor
VTSAESEIPLAGRVETAGLQLVLPRISPTGDRRIEDWLASNMDLESDPAQANHWNRLIENLPVFRRRHVRQSVDGPAALSQGGWSRFSVAYERGLTLVRMVDRSLVQQSQIQELGSDLLDLIDVGNHRLILNFTAVERLGSWIIGVVAGAHRRCALADGGKLKICGLDPQLAEIFAIVGMTGDIDLYPDEAAAIDSPWPERSTPRQLPVDILCPLSSIRELPPVCGGAPTEEGTVAKQRNSEERAGRGSPDPAARRTEGLPPWSGAKSELQVSLLVRVGACDPRTVVVSASRWLIGRDRTCQLRLGSAQVSKQHAVIEHRDGQSFLRDLDSTNGTLINGRIIRGLEVEVHHEDQIQIGPVLATVVIEPAQGMACTEKGPVDEMDSDHCDESAPPEGECPSTEELPLFDDLDPASRIKYEILEDVLVITPQIPELGEEEMLEALRGKLQSLYEDPLPRRVVVNLEFVNHLSRQAVAMLLAHHFRLEWGGGALRICQAHARIIALLDQVRLTMLVDCYPTLDEAVLAAWTGPPNGSPG